MVPARAEPAGYGYLLCFSSSFPPQVGQHLFSHNNNLLVPTRYDKCARTFRHHLQMGCFVSGIYTSKEYASSCSTFS